MTPTDDDDRPPGTDPVRWLSDAEQRAWRDFVNGARRLLDRLDHDLKAHGLTHDDYGVLVTLSEAADDRVRMAELADQSVQSRSRLSHHVGRLEARGLVRREACPNDRRGFFAVLTPKGRALLEATAPHHVTSVRTWFLDQVSTEELHVLARVFARIDVALGPEGRCPGADPPD